MSVKSNPQQQEVQLKELKPAKDLRYGNVVMFTNPNNGAVYTRKDKVFQTKKQVKEVALKIKKRIAQPNLFYVSPLTFEFDQIPVPGSKQSSDS